VNEERRSSLVPGMKGGNRLGTALTVAAVVIGASTLVIAALGVGAAGPPVQRYGAAAGAAAAAALEDESAGGGIVRIGIFPFEVGTAAASPSPAETRSSAAPRSPERAGGRVNSPSQSGSGSGRSSPPHRSAPPPSRPLGHGSKTPLPPSPPTNIWIPSIGVGSTLIRLGLNPDGSLEVPANFAVAGWWAGGRSPGERGAAVIVGHVDSKSGPAVFFLLRYLRHGDPIWVQRQDGRKVRFVVQRLEQVPKIHFPTQEVYGYHPQAMLRLITCGGAFNHQTGHYADNVIVFATASA
jgi:hypothetical protein